MPITTNNHRPFSASIPSMCSLSPIYLTPRKSKAQFSRRHYSYTQTAERFFRNWRLPPRGRHTEDLCGCFISVSYLFKITANYPDYTLCTSNIYFLTGSHKPDYIAIGGHFHLKTTQRKFDDQKFILFSPPCPYLYQGPL